MASVQTSSYDGRYLKLTVTQTKGTSEQNYSTINWTLESIGGNVNYYTIFKYGVWIDGTQRYDGTGLKTKNWDSYAFPAAKGSTSGSFIKYHNNDGSVSDISFSLYGSVFTSAENEYKGTLSMESIPRYAKVSTSTSNLTETSVKINWSSDAAISQVQYRLTVDGSTGSWVDVETGVNKTSGTYTISGLTPGKNYKIDYDYKRRDSNLWSFGAGYASSSNITTYNYPSCTVENFTITDNYIYINLYNPLSRNVKIEFYGNDGSLMNWGWRETSGRLGIGNGDEDRAREYASIPNSKSGSFYAKVIYGNIVNNSPSKTYSIKDDGTEIPTFNASNWSYTGNLTELTNNNQCIINGYSKVIFSIDRAATSDYGASISGYNYKWGNQSNNTGTITGGNGNLLEVAAIDSRGLNKPTSKTLISGENYVPYTIPSLDYSNSYTHRTDGISNETYLTLRGNLSVMKFGTGGVANAIHSAQYRVYDYSNNQWSGPYTIPVNSFTLSSSGYFSLNNYMIHANGSSGGFTTGKRYGIQIILKDGAGLLGTLTSNNILITDGKIARDVYQDSNGNYHQGINGMADENYAEKIYGNENIEGDLYINGNKKLTNTQIDKTLYAGDTGKQLKDIKINSDNIDAALLHRGTVGNLDTLYNAGLYRYANDNSKATTPFEKFNFGQVLVIPYRKGSGNTKTDFVVQMFFGDVEVAGYGGQIYYRFSYSSGWGNWYALHTKMEYGLVERPTGEVIEGKQVFTKTLKFTDSLNGGSTLSKAHGITGATRIWVDTTNSYFWNNKVSIPIPGTEYYGNFSDRIGIQINDTNVMLYADTNWNNYWEKVITLKYIK